jgi:uncharacterized protein YggE
MLRQQSRSIVYIILIAVLAMLFVACSPQTAQPGAAQAAQAPESAPEGGITVVGQGEAYGQPDRATLQLGVETFAENVADAISQNEENVQAVMAALEELGIPSSDIQTSNYSVWAEQRYGENGPEGIVGYRVSNMVTVVINDINSVGDVIGAVTEAGANAIHGISFSVADPAGLEAEAREAAIANAQEKAASLADLSGVELGEVIAVSEVVGQPGPIMEGMGGARVAQDSGVSPSISPGELAYEVRVQVTFAIR